MAFVLGLIGLAFTSTVITDDAVERALAGRIEDLVTLESDCGRGLACWVKEADEDLDWMILIDVGPNAVQGTVVDLVQGRRWANTVSIIAAELDVAAGAIRSEHSSDRASSASLETFAADIAASLSTVQAPPEVRTPPLADEPPVGVPWTATMIGSTVEVAAGVALCVIGFSLSGPDAAVQITPDFEVIRPSDPDPATRRHLLAFGYGLMVSGFVSGAATFGGAKVDEWPWLEIAAGLLAGLVLVATIESRVLDHLPL